MLSLAAFCQFSVLGDDCVFPMNTFSLFSECSPFLDLWVKSCTRLFESYSLSQYCMFACAGDCLKSHISPLKLLGYWPFWSWVVQGRDLGMSSTQQGIRLVEIDLNGVEDLPQLQNQKLANRTDYANGVLMVLFLRRLISVSTHLMWKLSMSLPRTF